MKRCSTLVLNAGELATPKSHPSQRSSSQGDFLTISHGGMAITEGKIVEIGKSDRLQSQYRPEQILDAGGGVITPSLCDPHTHLLFAGWRAAEFSERVSGQPVADPGLSRGIKNTVHATAKASDEELCSILGARLDHWLLSGVTCVEIKTGYGLSVESELRMLELTRRVATAHPIEVVPTVLAAHAVPSDYQGRADAYLDEVAWPVTQLAVERKLAEYADVFVEAGAFSVDQARRYLGRCKELGLGLRVHAEQLSRSGGAALAAKLDAASVDHLERAGEEEVELLRRSSCVAILLPGASLTVDGRNGVRPPARSLIQAGIPVAIASDFNPGTSTQSSPSLGLGLSTRLFGMTPAEALTAATTNAFESVGRGSTHGRLEAGYRADLCIWSAPCAEDLAYQLDSHRPRHVMIGGRLAVHDGVLGNSHKGL